MKTKKKSHANKVYSVPETVYVTEGAKLAITKAVKQLGFPSRSALLRRAIAEGIKTLDRYLPTDNL